MGDLVFNGIKVEELDLTNKIEGAVSLDISQRASFNVKYTRDDKKCAATLTIDMMDKNQPMDFNFKISAVAFFDCDQLSDKREIHKKAYDEIFPHVRSMVITFFVNSGLPPIEKIIQRKIKFIVKIVFFSFLENLKNVKNTKNIKIVTNAYKKPFYFKK